MAGRAAMKPGDAHVIPLSRIRAVWENNSLRGYQAKAAALGVSIGTMHRWARELALPNLTKRTDPRKCVDDADVRAVWADAGLPTMSAKAAALGIGVTTLQRHRRRLGLPTLSSGPKRNMNTELLALLWSRGVSSSEIGRLFGCRREVVVYVAGRLGLPARGCGWVPSCRVADVVTDLQQVALSRAMAVAAKAEADALALSEMVDGYRGPLCRVAA